ncbi:LysR family transcriptional regulator [Alteromonadaceae bacterium M269]|nr:LysR family transcriptional regulator [Alteromonadaceae bacterium M269]
MKIAQLKAFVQIAECQTYAEAAENLHLSQPAVSIAIKNLESEVGGKLFNRTTRQLELTPEGRDFLPVAQRLLRDFHRAGDELKSRFIKGEGSLTIAAMPSFASSMLPKALGEVKGKYSNVTIKIVDIVMDKVVQHVRENRAELGFVFEPENLTGLQFYPIFLDEFILVLPPQHELIKSELIEWHHLTQYPFVAMNYGSTMRTWLDKKAADMQLTLNIVAEASQFATIGQLVKESVGISVVPALCQEQMQERGLECLSLAHMGFSKAVGILTKTRANLSTPAQFLLDSFLNKKRS